MRVVVAGASGLIGVALLRALVAAGDDVVALVRAPDRLPERQRVPGVAYAAWTGKAGGDWMSRIEGAAAVVNLAGEPIAEGRWTPDKKARILQSRIESTHAMVEAIAAASTRPTVLINGSAVGVYGAHGAERVTEETPPGTDFLADVCQAWEEAAQPVTAHGVRLVLLRTGIVLAPDGGALATMLPLFRWGVGGALGSGRQGFPWIHLDDEVGLIRWAITTPTVAGPLNATAPNPVSNADFARTLGQALHKPALLPTPAFALRLILGEMADMVLTGAFVHPEKALAQGYAFREPALGPALKRLVGSGIAPDPTSRPDAR